MQLSHKLTYQVLAKNQPNHREIQQYTDHPVYTASTLLFTLLQKQFDLSTKVWNLVVLGIM